MPKRASSISAWRPTDLKFGFGLAGEKCAMAQAKAAAGDRNVHAPLPYVSTSPRPQRPPTKEAR